MRRKDAFDEIELPHGATGQRKVEPLPAGNGPWRMRSRLKRGFITLPAEWKERLKGQPTEIWAMACALMDTRPDNAGTVTLTNLRLREFGIHRRRKNPLLATIERLGLIRGVVPGKKGPGQATQVTRLLVE